MTTLSATDLLAGRYNTTAELIGDIYEFLGGERPTDLKEPDPRVQAGDVKVQVPDGGEVTVYLSRIEWDGGDQAPVICRRWHLGNMHITRLSPSILERFAGIAS